MGTWGLQVCFTCDRSSPGVTWGHGDDRCVLSVTEAL